MTDVVIETPEAAVEAVAPEGRFPGFWVSVGWIACYFGLQFLVTFLVLGAALGIDKLTDRSAISENPLLLMWSLIATVFIQLALMWLYLRKGERFNRLGLTHFGTMPVWRAIGLTFVLVVAAMAFNYLYATYLIPGIPMQDDIAKVLASIDKTALNAAVVFFAIAIAAPLVEEILFRGFLQNALGHYMPFWAAIILSSLGFAVVHGQPYAIPGLMSLSLAFGYIYHRTGSLRMNILLHMANNAMALTLIAIRPG